MQNEISFIIKMPLIQYTPINNTEILNCCSLDCVIKLDANNINLEKCILFDNNFFTYTWYSKKFTQRQLAEITNKIATLKMLLEGGNPKFQKRYSWVMDEMAKFLEPQNSNKERDWFYGGSRYFEGFVKVNDHFSENVFTICFGT